MFDNTRLSAELTHIQRALGEAIAQPHGMSLIRELRSELERPSNALLRQALLADCVRVAYSAVTTDITVREREVEAIEGFLAAAARHYAAMLPTSYGEFAASDMRAARAFLYRYAVDTAAFGRRATLRWPGLTLCHRAAQLGHPEAFERYAHLMSWLLAEAQQLAGHDGGLRWRGQLDELDELRGELAEHYAAAPAPDLRLRAFLTPTRVFGAVQQASSVFETDPFDVDTIHADARRTFARLVDYATAPAQATSNGWMLLVLGNSGSGKTHVLRSFRHYVHEFGRGFVVYAPFHSSSDDYPRYLLQHVVDSLSRPYTSSAGEHTGLHELASGLIGLADGPLRARLQGLTEGEWEVTETVDTFSDYVRSLVDELQRRPALQAFDPDLLRVLLFALYPAPGMTSRIYRYLRCLDMSGDDRQWLGNVVPRAGKDDPTWMIRDLARLAFVTRRAALVLMVDQAERTVVDSASGSASLRRVIDTLQGIVNEVPSAIAVVSYLSDLYDIVRPELTTSMLDRLERNPPTVRLKAGRSYDEIKAIVGRRLAWLYAEAGAVYRPETPVYPIPEQHLANLVGSRSRDVLEWCHRFQSQCVAAGRVIEAINPDESWDINPDSDLDQIATAWSEAQLLDLEPPEEEDEVLDVLVRAAEDCAEELGLVLDRAEVTRDGLRACRLSLARGAARVEVVLAMTNRGPQAGAFGGQLAALRKASRAAIPVALRTAAFPHGTASGKAMELVGKAGGRCVSLDTATLRTLVAFQRFRPGFPAPRITTWRQIERPMSTLPLMAEILHLDQLGAPSQVTAAGGVEPAGQGADPGVGTRRGARARGAPQHRRSAI